MSTETLSISPADLSYIHRSINSLSGEIGEVRSEVSAVGDEVLTARNELAQLAASFAEFVEADLKAKAFARAQTRQITVRQELERRFGYYDLVRRHVSGILQAADVNVVRQETVTAATESLMLSAPRYWLAPALVALANWLGDNRELANRAVVESCRRDDEKTSLFFALVSRRIGRPGATRTWMDRYIGLQDPTKLDRQTVVLIDALANGVLGPDVRAHCAHRIEAWVTELADRAGFVEEQRKNWGDALRSKTPHADNAKRYPSLAKFSPTWGSLNDSLNAVKIHGVTHEYFRAIFDGAIPPSPNLAAAVDELLDKLVQNFDDEELPLRREDQLCELIIEEEGDTSAAEGRQVLEAVALDEQVSFTQLLTNAAMHPETSHASRATQRFAVALSRHWIKNAHDDLTASIRAEVPLKVDIAIEGWTGETRKGDNEAELLKSLGAHIDELESVEMAKMKMQPHHWLGIGVGLACVAYGAFQSIIVAVIGAFLLMWVGAVVVGFKDKRAKLRERFATLRDGSIKGVKAVLSEMVEWRRDFARRDATAAAVGQLLDGISAEQYVLSSHDAGRAVLVKPAA